MTVTDFLSKAKFSFSLFAQLGLAQLAPMIILYLS